MAIQQPDLLHTNKLSILSVWLEFLPHCCHCTVTCSDLSGVQWWHADKHEFGGYWRGQCCEAVAVESPAARGQTGVWQQIPGSGGHPCGGAPDLGGHPQKHWPA